MTTQHPPTPNDDPFADAPVDPKLSDYVPPVPVAQWINGDKKLAKLGGIAAKGGVFIPNTQIEKFLAATGQKEFNAPGDQIEVTFAEGNTEAGFGATSLEIAVIKTRFRWVQKMSDGTRIFSPRRAYKKDATPKMIGNLQVLVVAKGTETFPFVIAFTGRNSQEFERVFSALNKEVMPIINEGRKGTPIPRMAIWFTLEAKAQEKAQENFTTMITPPHFYLPQSLTIDYLRQRYVGNDNLKALQEINQKFESWTREWDNAPTDGEHAIAESNNATGGDEGK